MDLIANRAIILLLAIALDFAIGEPPSPIHPTIWMGKEVAFLEDKFSKSALSGYIIPIIVICSFLVLSLILIYISGFFLNYSDIPFWVMMAVFLKPTFSIRPLITIPLKIERGLENGDIESSREMLTHLVRRDRDLDEKHIRSAAIESIGESGVDSIITPFLFYMVFGLPGAYFFRVVNTLDSMLGYRELGPFGKPSARLDDLCNFVGARLAAFLYALPKVMELEKVIACSKTFESRNAGYSISSMAIHLNTNVEKIDHYSLRVGRDPEKGDIRRAILCLIKAVAICLFILAPIMIYV